MDVEGLFGVVPSRFRIAMHPAMYRSAEMLNTASRAVAILHNMVVEQRRDQFAGRRRAAAAADRARRVAEDTGAVDARRIRRSDGHGRRAERTASDVRADARAASGADAVDALRSLENVHA